MDLGYGFNYRGVWISIKMASRQAFPVGVPGEAFLDHPGTPSRLAEHSGMGHPSFKNVETGYGSGMDFVVTKSR